MMNRHTMKLMNRISLIAVCSLPYWGTSLSAVESDLDFEWLEGDGIRYTTWSGSAIIPTESGEWSLGLSWQDVGLEYRSTGFPVDIITEDQDRTEQLAAFELEWSSWISESVQSRTGLTVSEGWGSHTGIWLDEYYRQVWKGRSINGDSYEDPSPSSLGLSQTVRWDYVPGTAQLLVTLGASRRDIAPGYEFEVEGDRAGELVRGISRLTDLSLDISSENSLHAKLKIRNGLTVSKTTEREERLTLRSGANIALDEYWVLRATGVYVRESSDFEAKKWSFSLSEKWGQNGQCMPRRVFIRIPGRLSSPTSLQMLIPNWKPWGGRWESCGMICSSNKDFA